MAEKRVTIPVGHRPAMRVPVGGSRCSNCTFYRPPPSRGFGTCAEPNYRAYYGTTQIPCPPDEYCSDWYEPNRPLRNC